VAITLARIPVVGGVAYAERVRQLPSTFTATLAAEPGNRYFLQAVAVLVDGEKVGYLAPEISANYYDVINGRTAPVTCPGRRGSHSDHETSGVEVLLDFSGIDVQPLP
jgi:hypothetical protein